MIKAKREIEKILGDGEEVMKRKQILGQSFERRYT